MKQNLTKEIIKGAQNDTKHQNSAHPKQSYRVWCGAADQGTMSHGTMSHDDIENDEIYNISVHLKPNRKE